MEIVRQNAWFHIPVMCVFLFKPELLTTHNRISPLCAGNIFLLIPFLFAPVNRSGFPFCAFRSRRFENEIRLAADVAWSSVTIPPPLSPLPSPFLSPSVRENPTASWLRRRVIFLFRLVFVFTPPLVSPRNKCGCPCPDDVTVNCIRRK